MATRKSTSTGTKKTTSAKKPKAEKPVIEEKALPVETAQTEIEAPQPVVQAVVYKNAGDEMMTVIHLSSSRTPVSYGNGKKKVFERFGDRFSLSVREFEQEFAPAPVADALLKQKILAVGEDCPKEIRERLDIDFDDNELLTPTRYKELMKLDKDAVCELFEQLCIEHKRLVARLFMDDFEGNQGLNCQRDKIMALNEISKRGLGEGERGLFAGLLEDISAKEAANY